MRKKIAVFILLCTVLFLTSGCWDKREIEELAFVIGVALDPVNGEDEQITEIRETMPGVNINNLFTSTFQIAIPGQLSTEGGGGGGGMNGGQSFYNESMVGVSNFHNIRNLMNSSSRRLNFEHARVLIIHEELAQRGLLKHVMDLFVRDHEMRRKSMVFISRGEAKKILDVQPPLEDFTAMYIERVAENYEAASGMMPPREFGDISRLMLGSVSYVIPGIKYEGEHKLSMEGAAVFNGLQNVMVGWLDAEEMMEYNLIMGEQTNTHVEVPFRGQHFTYEIAESHPSLTYERKNGEDHFRLEIKTSGFFSENWVNDLLVDNVRILMELEKAAESQIKKEVENLLHRAQHEFHVDLFRFDEKVRAKEYDYWKDIKETWDGEDGKYTEAKIDVHVKATIEHYMTDEGLDRKRSHKR